MKKRLTKFTAVKANKHSPAATPTNPPKIHTYGAACPSCFENIGIEFCRTHTVKPYTPVIHTACKNRQAWRPLLY